MRDIYIKKGICIVGLGYVGMQLARNFQRSLQVYGVDTNEDRINKFRQGIDETESLKQGEEDLLRRMVLTTDINEVPDVKAYIVCVPTPVNQLNKPDTRILEMATQSVGGKIRKGDLIVFESTVAPKTTENICIPILERISGMKCDKDFYVGFSPERLQPGIGGKRLEEIVKLVSGHTQETEDKVWDLYSVILPPNLIHRCGKLAVAETAKLMENVKRDVNIALMNQFQMICHDTGINFEDVLECARTKFNFDRAQYTAGMVGGHCIGVDPYYMIDYAENNVFSLNGNDLIGEARKINSNIPNYLASLVNKELHYASHAKITILGFSFKENCADIRNTKIYDLYKVLTEKYKYEVSVYDPKCDKKMVKREYGIDLVDEIPEDNDCIFIALKENQFAEVDFENKLSKNGFVFDYKGLLKNNKQCSLPLNKIYAM